MIRIANPIYDVVFRYLLEDKESALLFLSRLFDITIDDIEFLVRERTTEIEKQNLTVYRLDFSAKVVTTEGTHKQVIIELQKAKYLTDILRFRKYLGEEYASRAHVTIDAGGHHHVPPIISAYILGYNLEAVESPVVKVNRQVTDLTTGAVVQCNEAFIESLTHDCYIVQVKRLKRPYRSNLEKFLAIFDQECAVGDQHVLEVDDTQYPAEMEKLLRRLGRAAAEPKVRDSMDLEDEVLEELKARERQVYARDEVIRKQEQALQEKEQALEEQSKALEEKDKVLEEKDKALREQARLIEALQQKLVSASDDPR